MYVIYKECSAIARIRVSDRCVSAIARRDDPIDVTSMQNRALHVRGKELFIGGSLGTIHVLDGR